MKRAAAPIFIFALALAASLAFTACEGCDEGESRTRIPQSRVKPVKRWDDLTAEEQAKVTEQRHDTVQKYLIWPEDAGPPRDPVADYDACAEAMRADPRAAHANPLVQMVWVGRCLSDKGWVIDQEAELPQG